MSISSMSKLSVTFQFLSLCSHHSVSCHNTCIFIGSKTFIHSENRQEGSVHSVMSNSATPWTAAFQAFLSITNSQSLFKLMSIESMMPSNHLFLCHPLFLPPSNFPSIRVSSNVHSPWQIPFDFASLHLHFIHVSGIRQGSSL